jgi:hypothetical protein
MTHEIKCFLRDLTQRSVSVEMSPITRQTGLKVKSVTVDSTKEGWPQKLNNTVIKALTDAGLTDVSITLEWVDHSGGYFLCKFTQP